MDFAVGTPPKWIVKFQFLSCKRGHTAATDVLIDKVIEFFVPSYDLYHPQAQ